MLGDHAIAEGALAAGVRFFGGYPITPSTEVAERMAERLPDAGGLFVQMEDELASMAVILGVAWRGLKTRTATSGPGFSLMTENRGLGIITETPTLVCNVQRGGSSTGLPALVAQSDMMQARWGSHGHYEIIALAPWSGQECFDLTVRAVNLSERYRVPVVLLADAEVGHLTEKVVIPPAREIEVWDRREPAGPPAEFDPPTFNGDLVPPMPRAGQGYQVFVECLTDDERGYRVMTAAAQKHLVKRLIDKISANRFEIYDYEEDGVEGADVVVLASAIVPSDSDLPKQLRIAVDPLRLPPGGASEAAPGGDADGRRVRGRHRQGAGRHPRHRGPGLGRDPQGARAGVPADAHARPHGGPGRRGRLQRLPGVRARLPLPRGPAEGDPVSVR